MSLNNSIVSGRIGKKPELKKTNDGTSWVKFSVATEEKWKDKKTGETKKRTDWHTVKAWRGLAEIICQYAVQGQYVEVQGKLRCDAVEKNGTTNYYHYIDARLVEFREKPKAWWDAYNAAKAAGTPMPTNNPAPPAAKKQPTIGELMQQISLLNQAVQGLAGAGVALPPAQQDEGAGFVPPEEEDYSAGPYDGAPAPAPATQPRVIHGL